MARINQINSSGAALVAQWIEQEPSNLLVAGSIPAEGAKASISNGDRVQICAP